MVQVEDTATLRPALTISEAVQACEVSRATLKRRLGAGELPGAYKDEEGSWRIPVDVLLAAGFRLHRPGPVHEPAQTQGHEPSIVDELRDRVARLTAELAEARARAEERDRALATLELALRTLGPAPTSPNVEPTPGPRRRRWRRSEPRS